MIEVEARKARATRGQHLDEAAGCFSAEQRARLDAVSAPPKPNPYFIFDLPRDSIFGGRSVAPWPHHIGV